jgi:hypothetical protein
LDLLASFAFLLGRELERDEGLDSLNQLETILRDPIESARDQLVLLPREEKSMALRKGDWVYISSQGDGSGEIGTSKRGGPWAVGYTSTKNSDIGIDGSIRSDAPIEQLYNLKTDPYQTANIVRDHPRVAAQMRAGLLMKKNEGSGG